MNVIKHRIYRLELDVWEPLEKRADEEIDGLIKHINSGLHHCAHVKMTKVSEERQ